MSNATIRHFVVGSLVIVALAVTLWSAAAQAGPTPTPTATPTATPTRTPPSTYLINGNFETGDLTGWTVFTTRTGTNGGPGYPNVVLFDTDNDGFATYSARFRVGRIVSSSGRAGGGLFQQVELLSGELTIEADIASLAVEFGSNYSGGIFELMLDGVRVDLHGFGEIAGGETKHAMLSSTSEVTAGTHEIRIRITRDATSEYFTPQQFVDNVTISGTATGTPTATPTPTPTPGADCLCEVQNINPNQIVLQNVATGGKGSDRIRTMVMALDAVDAPGASCDPGEFSAPTPIRLKMEDDRGNVLVDSVKITVCEHGETTNVRRDVFFQGPLNCEGGAQPPPKPDFSLGVITSTASAPSTADYVEGIRIKCFE